MVLQGVFFFFFLKKNVVVISWNLLALEYPLLRKQEGSCLLLRLLVHKVLSVLSCSFVSLTHLKSCVELVSLVFPMEFPYLTVGVE